MTSKNYPDLLQEFVAPGLLKVSLSRPKQRNSASLQLITSVSNILTDVSSDDSVQCVILTGDPKAKAFSAGADLALFADEANSGPSSKIPTADEYRDPGGFSSIAALRCTKPIICAINGPAVGWGLALTLACDIRIVNQDTRVGFPMAARGLVNESISSYLLQRIIGTGVARELVYTGRVFKASDARDIAPSLFNYILPEDQVLKKAIEIGTEIVTNCSPLSVQLCKLLMNEGHECSPEQAMMNESKCQHYVTYVKNDDLKEGITSFIQKRKPEWILKKQEDLPPFLPFSHRIGIFTDKVTLPNQPNSKL